MKMMLGLLLFAVFAFGTWEWRAVATLRRQTLAQREAQTSAGVLSNEIAALERTLAVPPEQSPDFDRSELLRLRNAVRRLRAAPTDPGLLRAENERLQASLNIGNVRPPRLADQSGFVARNAWANVGNATAEAALQTVLYAMREANLELLATLLEDSEAESLRRQLQEDPVRARNRFLEELKEEFTPTGFLVVGREDAPGGRQTLKVKFDARSEPMEMEFRRLGDSWKMTKGF